MFKQLGVLIVFLAMSSSVLAKHAIKNENSHHYFGQLEYFSDEKKLSLSDVINLEKKAWKNSSLESATFGFDKQHYWFRLPLKNTYASDSPWLLRSKYPLLDSIDVYLFSASNLVQEFHAGDLFPYKDRPFNQPDFVFPLSISNDAPHKVYIHIQTTSSVQLSLTLETETSFWRTIAHENIAKAAFYAVLISMIFYSAVIFLIIRERSYFYYVLFLGSFTLFMGCLHGWAYKFLWPNSPLIHQLSVVIMIGITIFTAALFTSSYLRLKEISPTFYKIFITVAIVALISVFFSLFLPYALMIRINIALAIIASGIAIFSTIHQWLLTRNREVMIFIIAWITLLVGFLLYSGQSIGLLPLNDFTEHAIEIGAILESIFLALGLADRINSERKSLIEMQENLLKIQVKANEELDNKVRARTIELESINNQLQISSVTDSLTQLKNRRYFDHRYYTEYRRAYREKAWLSLLMLDIDHFKRFNDDYGHQAGDKVLQSVAAAMQGVVKRPEDTVFRYGGEEFTILLPNTPKEGALLIAERIRREIESLQVEWQGNMLSVTMSLGLAVGIPASNQGGAVFLKQADYFLYLAKGHGRNQVIHEDNLPED
jgi:diguanylate cyclase (GGDEF)-like protein